MLLLSFASFRISYRTGKIHLKGVLQNARAKICHPNGTKRGKDISFCDMDGLMPPQELGVGAEVPKKNNGRVVLRGDVVKGDSGSHAVFTQQGSSASQTTAAKVRDVIARLPGCARQASDAVSAYIQVKMVDAPKLLKLIRLPRHKWPKSFHNIEEPVVSLERNLYGRSLVGLSWERQFERSSSGKWLGESTNLGMLGLCIASKVYFCLCTSTTAKCFGEITIWNLCGKD